MQTISSLNPHLHITTTTLISPTRPDPAPISLPLFPTRTRFPSLKTNASSASNGAVTAKLKKEVSYYEVLGISETVTATATEIKKAYKQLASKYHPDVSPPGKADEYTEKFIRVQEAYETLSDATKRAMYDRDMARGMQLAFSTRQYQHFDRDVKISVDWRNGWQSQLSELKKRSSYKDDRNMTWGARMRRQREKVSKEV